MSSKFSKGTRRRQMPPQCPNGPDDGEPIEPPPPHEAGYFMRVKGTFFASHGNTTMDDERLLAAPPATSGGAYSAPSAGHATIQYGACVNQKEGSGGPMKTWVRAEISEDYSGAGTPILDQYYPLQTQPWNSGPITLTAGPLGGFTGTVECRYYPPT